MNAQEKRWINKWLHKIWVIDNENDSQADDINDFLWELARRTNDLEEFKKFTELL